MPLRAEKTFLCCTETPHVVLHEVSAQTLSEEAALKAALRSLIANKDGHFVAAVTAMFQSPLEAKLTVLSAGVFGAGKTLLAAAMIAGLLVMDPSFKIMIVTKENVAAHAFARQFLRLELPDPINCMVGSNMATSMRPWQWHAHRASVLLFGAATTFFFCCIAELAIKPCRSSRSKLRGEFGIPKHLQNRKQKHNKATNTPNPKHNTKQKEHGKCWNVKREVRRG